MPAPKSRKGDHRLVVLSKRIIMLTHEFEEAYLIKRKREEG